MKITGRQEAKHIVILAPQQTSILDVAGPVDVFGRANIQLKNNHTTSPDAYQIHVVALDDQQQVITSTGLPIITEGSFRSISYPIDTLLVAGYPNIPEVRENKVALNWLRANWQNIRRVGSVCAGAFMLANAGILNGKKATTHWQLCAKMTHDYPEIEVDPDPIFVKDGSVYTSAGISAGMDLALAMVEEDFGRELALQVARTLVLYLKRPGNQSQFSVALNHQEVDYQPIQELLDWIPEHLNDKLNVEQMAEQVAMSPRNFARVFYRETGITPAKYLEKLRVETARRRLEESNLTLEEISGECGLGSADTLRRIFLRHFKTTPADYRRSFKSALV
ncbi:MAG TPA: GlxA family transcriptional regulator [Sunxiuqinia sp.]|nr:GlxA family transcriptional regulator [Sunxiuqinia sp.]